MKLFQLDSPVQLQLVVFPCLTPYKCSLFSYPSAFLLYAGFYLSASCPLLVEAHASEGTAAPPTTIFIF